MLEVLAHDRSDGYALTHAGDAGPERADTTDDQVDSTPRLRSRIESGDTRRVHERVEFQDDACGPTGTGVVRLSLDHVQYPVAQVHRGHDEAPEVPLPRQPGQDVEQVTDVGAELRPA